MGGENLQTINYGNFMDNFGELLKIGGLFLFLFFYFGILEMINLTIFYNKVFNVMKNN